MTIYIYIYIKLNHVLSSLQFISGLIFMSKINSKIYHKCYTYKKWTEISSFLNVLTLSFISDFQNLGNVNNIFFIFWGPSYIFVQVYIYIYIYSFYFSLIILMTITINYLLHLIHALYCQVLSKEVSGTILKVFGMMRPGIKPRSSWPKANTLTTRLIPNNYGDYLKSSS